MARIKKIKFCSPNTAIFGHVTRNRTLLCIFLSTISVVCLLFYLNFLHELQIQIFVPFFQLIVTFSHALSFNIGFFSPNFLCFFPQKMLKLFYSLFLFLALGQEGSSMQYYTVLYIVALSHSFLLISVRTWDHCLCCPISQQQVTYFCFMFSCGFIN